MFIRLIIGLIVVCSSVMALEKPDYTLLKTIGKVELRHYSKLLLAEVQVTAETQKEAGDKGFTLLADYIFKNSTERISMTAPVLLEPRPKSTYKMAFVMPDKYTLKTLPKPDNPVVKFRVIENMYVVATRFSGRNIEKNFESRIDVCKKILKQEKLRGTGAVFYAYYSPPFLPPFLRKNEILLPYIKN